MTIPRELGPVRLLREIGRGGMGVVYLGWHQMLDRDVAVKFLLNAVAGPDDPGFAGFLEGARAAARLEHPGLTTIHHADVVDGIPYLVMQYIDGPALSDVVRKTGPLSLPASFTVLDAVSEAIGELHDRGIIHRDIKPSNVMLGLDGRVVVTDFGLSLARPMGQRGPSSPRLGGTPVYMAPEMFIGEVSLRSDVYALGMMTFELLTGELPFAGTLEEVREKHLHEPLPLEPLQRRRLDPAMIEVLERATHKNAMFRYKTARQFLRALKEAISGSEAWSKGAAELSALVARCGTEPTEVKPPERGSSSSDAYFDTLATVAAGKRQVRPHIADAHQDVPEPLSSTMSPRYQRLSRLIPEVALFETDEQRKAAMRRASSITARGSGRLWIWLLLFLMTLGIIPLLMRVTGLDVEWGRLQTKYPIVRLIYGPLMMLLMYSWLWFCRSVIRPRLRAQLVAKGIPICVPCGYNLRGQVDPRCPECGTAFDEKLLSAARVAPKTTPASTYFDRLSEIADDKRGTQSPRAGTREAACASAEVDEVPSSNDISCIHCGYNLRGLPGGGRCPECGTEVARSSHGNLLSAADPAWLARVLRGQALAYAGCVALLVRFVFSSVTASGSSLATWAIVDSLGASSVVETVSEAVLSAAVALFLLLGAFGTTTIDPRLSLTEQPIALRRFVRWSIVAMVALALSGYLVPTVFKQLGVGAEVAALCGTVLLSASGLVFLSALVGICYYLAGLAMRIPDAVLATRTRSKAVRFAGCIGIVVLMVVWAVLTHGSGASAVGSVNVPGRVVDSPMFLILVLPMLILTLVAGGYAVVLMNLMSAYRKAFRKALLEARKRATAQDGHI
ncbi:MAG: protein kinase [Planctomycetes bacterium]|nr:protein kinase [Planctomycetota bacterium]